MYYIFTISQYIYINELHLIGPPRPLPPPLLSLPMQNHIYVPAIYIFVPRNTYLCTPCAPHTAARKTKVLQKTIFSILFCPFSQNLDWLAPSCTGTH